MALLKTLLILALLGLALARPDTEDREIHRAHKQHTERRHSLETDSHGENLPPLERCNTHVQDLGICPPGHFCLRDDWRCGITSWCEHKGGWCFPIPPNIPPAVQVESKREETSESE
ncbi:hypothetical protein PMAYCL1PPCAC_15070 [Pristionchus mayeri]|uniref:P-type domain-containing protein n=1 Tax=Pristionchus mayeri TaxID=1317129 RepID=A0AAN5CIB3_9BILA|nr:hypothetical protein PMAYCL1PPCAC_15070 [Pristionchus mayeri]